MTKIFSEFSAAVTFLWFFLLVVAKERTTNHPLPTSPNYPLPASPNRGRRNVRSTRYEGRRKHSTSWLFLLPYVRHSSLLDRTLKSVGTRQRRAPARETCPGRDGISVETGHKLHPKSRRDDISLARNLLDL
jgi:hypothetical protein